MGNAKGMVGSCTDGTNTATFSYKRIPDIVGKWRMVTKHGVEAQLEALGVTGPEKDKMAANFIPTSVEGKAVTGGRWRWESTPKIHSDIEFAMNEEYSYTGRVASSELSTSSGTTPSGTRRKWSCKSRSFVQSRT